MHGLNHPHDVQDIRHHQRQNIPIEVLLRCGTMANLCHIIPGMLIPPTRHSHFVYDEAQFTQTCSEPFVRKLKLYQLLSETSHLYHLL